MSNDYIFSDGTEAVICATQEEAIRALCEWLLRDPSGPRREGAVLSVTHGEDIILRYRMPS